MKKHDRGWATMDAGMALVVLMVVVVFGLSKLSDWQQQKNWQIDAARTSAYAAAARAYVGHNYVTLLNASTTTAPTVITTAMLKSTGFLPSGFTETNSQGQKMQTYLVRNGQNIELLQGMVVSSGGSVFPAKALRLIARDIKTGFGGYIEDGITITGALRAWQIPLSSYGASSGNGHLAVLLSTDELSGAQEDNDRLYRFQVNGRPDLNKMHTSIDMGGNNLENVGNIGGQNGFFNNTVSGANGSFTGNVNASNGIFTSNVNATNGIFTSNVNATNGIFNGTVSGANGSFSQNLGAGGQVSGNTLWAGTDIGAGRNISATNQVSGASVYASGNLSAGGVLQLGQVNNAGWGCYPNGQVSRDASGGILSCRDGAWVSPAGKPRMTEYTYTNYATSYNYSGIGVHDFCTSQYGNENDRSDSWRGVERLADGSWRITVKDGSETAMCLDW
ncbi:TPA: shufflon system plasmid conjugative transfer pilus tip adhesin PilV [Citrobacter freundii]|uniref:shufflon system plasmid conjugative transfer pilus tip adhesin PilV n=1 Tax=Leclercia adecarboxylata TaxID=83655 RepID=UPI00178C6FE3|nr:shufflon system plasmid conjugative transfer pilus tip adhesin PilV [Leclercia adecarboxylata]HED2436071.1 shufflon system plasmid conjugative transfer pilus tip adhesin PilV [Citrobacter freundii]